MWWTRWWGTRSQENTDLRSWLPGLCLRIPPPPAKLWGSLLLDGRGRVSHQVLSPQCPPQFWPVGDATAARKEGSQCKRGGGPHEQENKNAAG